MKGLYGRYIYLVLCFPFLFLSSCSIPKTNTESTQTENLEAAIKSSAKYLQNRVKENGMFEYRVNIDPSVYVKPKYNILRHAGTIYAMSQYLEIYPEDKEMRKAVERAGIYLQKQAIETVSGKEDMLAVWSNPEINNSGRPLEA
ncbi:MAG: hypothetical protein GWO07_16080 [Candidatus Dadabacteria bacterium]|nr:hypothetical protein [Candidatus Dadabacteria bacterium]NIS10222.1 hypothetical protein [Candidatus Dadabacteria bacterium]NIV42667.1 hypothetical protein [Candidatus Dadabacteria bacterium]NIX16590.1 hypothetical protein [Candidatus Dadabacteria bacterium]NIY23137.1 hypothetical protein [Candidatus Dadabacteria bacterium]